MGETVTSSAIKNLVHNLDREKDVDLPPEVKDQVRSFRVELKKAVSFLSYYSEPNLNDNETADLEIEIRDVVYEAVDTIDELMVNCCVHQRRKGKLGMLFRCLGHKHKLFHDATARIDDLKLRLEKIKLHKQRGSTGSTSFSCRALSMTVEAVGFDGEVEELVKQLTQGGLRQLDVVSIFGIEGLGKTTLAKKVYNDGAIKAHFDCRVCVHVPQEYKTAALLQFILKIVSPMDHLHDNNQANKEEEEEDLKEALFKHLKGRKYLIVMDNVWCKEVWDEVKPAFPDDSNGSRILITSRLRDVATHASRIRPPHEPNFLSDEDSWELLRRKALIGQESCPPELEKIGRQIAKKCDGFPLAIVLLGGILARKEKTIETWSALADKSSTYLMDHGKRCGDIALSYHNLPPHLKICLLYFGMFPEHHKITARQLIQLWIAEGFIEEEEEEEVDMGTQKKKKKTMEDVGEQYLDELIGRSLVQVDAKRTLDGGVKTCSIRNLFRELCISAAEEKNHFLVVHDNAAMQDHGHNHH